MFETLDATAQAELVRRGVVTAAEGLLGLAADLEMAADWVARGLAPAGL